MLQRLSCVSSVEIEPNVPLRLKHGDVIGMGNTELLVHFADADGQENVEY